MDYKRTKWSMLLCAPLFLASIETSLACTRVLEVDSKNAVMVGRNMDWLEDLKTNIFVFPKGIERNGESDTNNLNWTSKYGSIVTTAFDDISTDGFNETGFAAHILWLNSSDYGERDNQKPGLSVKSWLQFYLDNFQSVEEAVRFTEGNHFQITPFYQPESQRWMRIDLALDDASGDSAIFEYNNGELKIYHDRANIVTTNDPTYDKQLANLKDYKVFGGEKPLPGSNKSEDRFVRATFFTQNLPQVESTQEQLAAVFSILNNASQPYFKFAQENPYQSKTLWHTVSDLTNKVYYFQSTATLNLLVMKMDHFNMNTGAPIMKLDMVNHPEYIGAVEDKFQPLGLIKLGSFAKSFVKRILG